MTRLLTMPKISARPVQARPVACGLTVCGLGFILVIGLGIALGLPLAAAKELDPEAKFRRCYGLVTQSFPGLGHQLLARVRANQIDAISACLEVLDLARLGQNGVLSQSNDSEARAVLQNFQSLHYSWFSARDFDTPMPDLHRNSTRDLYDISSPSYYFTKALFDPAMAFSAVFQGSGETLAPVRTNMNPDRGRYTGVVRSNWLYQGNFDHVPYGDLLGLRSLAPTVVTQGPSNSGIFGPELTLFRHFGGGVLGSSPYIGLNVFFNSLYATDGAKVMPRTWSKAILSDFMCRELPVLRSSDITSYIVPESNVAFRRAASCVRCHATMDQMAATIRAATFTTFELGYTGSVDEQTPSGILVTIHREPDSAPEIGWPAEADGDFFRRPPRGRFLMRTFDGQLVDQALTSTESLGQELSRLDDPYVCLTKRYYHYFMGVNIPMTDFADPDPATGLVLQPNDQRHWENILRLGKSFKTHQSARRLIEEILRLPGFGQSDFGI